MMHLSGKNAWVDRVMQILCQKEWDTVVVPSQVVRQVIIQRIQRGWVPKIVTYGHPMGYADSVIIQDRCLHKSQAIVWIADFLYQKKDHDPHLKNSAIQDLAHSFWMLWEHMEAHNKDWSDIVHYDGVFLGGKAKTLHLLKEWAQWWPEWVRSRGWISQSEYQQKARQAALSLWDRQKKDIVCIVDPVFFDQAWDIEQWIGHVCVLSCVRKMIVDSKGHICDPQRMVAKKQCATSDDKARAMALLVARYGSTNRSVAIYSHSFSLLQKVNFFLKKWGLSLPIYDHDLFKHFVLLTVRWAEEGCDVSVLIALLYHPWVRHFYPIAPQMGAWIKRWQGDNFKKDFIQWVHSGQRTPLWTRRVVDHIQAAFERLSSQVQQETAMNVSDWVRIHVDAIFSVTPPMQRDADIMEKMFDWIQKSEMQKEPVVGFSVYRIWLNSMLDDRSGAHKKNSSIKVYTCDKDVRWIDCDYCIYDSDCSENKKILSWVPRKLQDRLGLSADNHPPALGSRVDKDLFHTSCSVDLLRCHSDSDKHFHRSSQIWLQKNTKEKNWGNVETKSFVPPLHKVSISDIQAWIQNPDLFYKRRLLKIRPVEMPPFQRWGLLIHRILDDFVRFYPPSHHASLDEMTEALCRMCKPAYSLMPWWKASWIEKLCASIACCEYNMRQQEKYTSMTEQYGFMDIPCGRGTVRLTGRVDRIDIFPDKSMRIIDYKTGTVPPYVSMDRLQSVQLPLEGLMGQKGAFAGESMRIRQLCWWHLSLSKGCSVKSYPRSLNGLIQKYDKILPTWMSEFSKGSYLFSEKGGVAL